MRQVKGGGGLVVDMKVIIPATAIDAFARRVATIVVAEIMSTTTTGTPYMTVAEAAVYLRCSRQRVDDLLSSRRLTRCKEGRRTLIRRDEVEAWVRVGD